MTLIRQRFYVDERRDADLLAFLSQQPNKSETIRQAVYEYMARHADGNGGADPDFDWDLLGIVVRNAVQESLAAAQITVVSGQQGAQPQAGQEAVDDGIQDGLDSLLDAWDL